MEIRDGYTTVQLRRHSVRSAGLKRDIHFLHLCECFATCTPGDCRDQTRVLGPRKLDRQMVVSGQKPTKVLYMSNCC